jgi:hypothetical protein
LEFSTVEESKQGSSATDWLSEDVTGGWKKEEGRRKKEEGRRKDDSSNSQSQCFSAQLSIPNDQ